MKIGEKKFFTVAALSVLSAACSGTNPTTIERSEHDSTARVAAALGGIGSIAMPKSFAGGRVSVAMADAWTECPHSPEVSRWQAGATEFSFDAPLTAIRKDMRAAIAACQGTGGLQVTGDLFKDWVALRGTLACNVDA